MTLADEIRFNENLKKLGDDIWERFIVDENAKRLSPTTKVKIVDISCLYRHVENFWTILPETRRSLITYEKRAVLWIYLMQKGLCGEKSTNVSDDYISLAVAIYDAIRPRFNYLWANWKAGEYDDDSFSGCSQLENVV